MIRSAVIACLLATAHAWEVRHQIAQPQPGEHFWRFDDVAPAAGWRVYAQQPTGSVLLADIPNTFGRPGTLIVDAPDGPVTLTAVAYSESGQEARGDAYTIIPAKVEASRDLKTWKVVGYRDKQDRDFVRLKP